jgi:cytochrome c oxidase cbb3-type subunit I/II
MDRQSGEFVYDHPFLWGQNVLVQFVREEVNTMTVGILITSESSSISPGSIMPGYKWLFDNKPWM